jgi:N-acetylmuramoyl-L-alanine amidase
MSTGLKRAIVTAAILAGSAILSSKVQAQGPKSYPENSTNKTIHASTPTNLESRINFYNFGLIALDPGHDTVCNRPPVNGIYEKDLNLIVANMTSSLLRDKGHDVISTRKDGYGVNKDNIDVNNDKEVNLKDELDAIQIW